MIDSEYFSTSLPIRPEDEREPCFDKMDWTKEHLSRLSTQTLLWYFRRFVTEMRNNNWNFGYGFNPADPEHSFDMGIRAILINKKLHAVRDLERVLLNRIPEEQINFGPRKDSENLWDYIVSRYESDLVQGNKFDEITYTPKPLR